MVNHYIFVDIHAATTINSATTPSTVNSHDVVSLQQDQQ